MLDRSCDGSLIVLLFEGLNVLDVGDIVFDSGEGRQSLCGNGISEILLDLHGYFNGIQRIKSMLLETAFLRNT